jgi:hypothetical protein
VARPGREARAGPARSSTAVAQHLSRSAQLEAASIVAFIHLALELRAHGAPPWLATRSMAAAREEERHARITAALARRAGARVVAPSVELTGVRSLEAIAIENASEGCVREAFGAMLLAEQAGRVADPRLARSLYSIARDEAHHAALSFEIDDHLRARLPPVARRRVADAHEAAVSSLGSAHDADPCADLRSQLGMPSAERAQTLLRRSASLWSARACIAS